MYAKIQNRQVIRYPYTVDDLRQDNPQTSFPAAPTTDTLAEFGVVPVVVIGRPAADYTQTVIEGLPVFNEAAQRWEQDFVVVQATESEVAQRTEVMAAQVRAERTRLLAESDWTQLPDAPVPQLPWAQYRQALRDITSQPGFPSDVQWPDVPA